jgi:hypothetical protein
MPFFHVRTSVNTTKDFVVEAVDRKIAQEKALMFEFGGANKKTKTCDVIEVSASDAETIDVVTADRAAWLDAKKRKGR